VRKATKVESESLSSLEDDTDKYEDEIDDFSVESVAYQSTNASSRTTPILADQDI